MGVELIPCNVDFVASIGQKVVHALTEVSGVVTHLSLHEDGTKNYGVTTADGKFLWFPEMHLRGQ